MWWIMRVKQALSIPAHLIWFNLVICAEYDRFKFNILNSILKERAVIIVRGHFSWWQQKRIYLLRAIINFEIYDIQFWNIRYPTLKYTTFYFEIYTLFIIISKHVRASICNACVVKQIIFRKAILKTQTLHPMISLNYCCYFEKEVHCQCYLLQSFSET